MIIYAISYQQPHGGDTIERLFVEERFAVAARAKIIDAFKTLGVTNAESYVTAVYTREAEYK